MTAIQAIDPAPTTSESQRLYRRAEAVMPRGNTRHSVFFAPYPLYCVGGDGCRIIDADGIERLDFVNNYSSLVHGHGHPDVVEAIVEQVKRLIAVGLPTETEIDLAEHLCGRFDLEQVRFTNSGTEAVMMALKLARAYTSRPLIAKFEGCYHGTYDSAEVSQAPPPAAWGPADAPASVALSRGTPKSLVQDTLVLPFNNVAAVRQLLERHGSRLAGVLVDLAPAHLGYLTVAPEILSLLENFCGSSGTLLVIDEVYSLRFDYHGAQRRFGIRSDITVMGKIIGGGLPIGAVGASAGIMSMFDPLPHGPAVVHGGTYNANPLTMAAGLASMRALSAEAIAKMEMLGDYLRAELCKLAERHGEDVVIGGLGSVISITFGRAPLHDYRDRAALSDHKAKVLHLHRAMMDRGVLIASQGLAVLSTAMGNAEAEAFLTAADAAFGQVGKVRR